MSRLKESIISEILITPRVAGNPVANPPVPAAVAIQRTGPTSQINSVKLYVQIVTLSKNNNMKFLANIRPGFKRAISWNKYRSDIKTKPKSYNLDYMIDPAFREI